MDIWTKIKEWFEDVYLPCDDEYWIDQPKAKTQTSEKPTKSSESP